MASIVKFDMSDPAIKKMIDGWSDSTEYKVLMTVRTGTGAARNVCEVIDAEEEGGAEDTSPNEEASEGEPGGAESGAPGPAAVKAAMGGPMMREKMMGG